MNTQYSIFDIIYPKYKITKPIRLIELFAGYGSQALALKYLGVPFEHWKICEWAVKSIQAYKDIHFANEKDIGLHFGSQEPNRIYNILWAMGISQNYNEPMTLEQIKRLGYDKAKQILDNIHITHNLVNIQQVNGEMLEIVDTDKYCYIMTYSFPCQDLSLAGKGKGMGDTSTRSGMLWEVERILQECKDLGELPQVLLMENVPQVHGEGNVEDFNKWQLRLEELGYKNYWQDLIATDYGIPQTRNRTFMVSILGDYSYTFPKPVPLKLKLKDMLEDNVDEKYYLSDKQIESLESGNYNASKPSVKLEITDKGLCQTLDTMSGGNRQPLVRVGNKSLQETLKQNEIDDTCYIDTYNKRIDKDKSGTITTGVSFRNNTFVAEKQLKKELCNDLIKNNKVQENDVIRHNYTTSKNGDCIQSNNEAPTLDTRCDCLGVCVKGIATNESENWQKPPLEEKSRTILANKSNGGVGLIDTNLRIRKLTPKECFRLMGVKDEDYEKVAKNQSNASLYHLAGDSIVVNVLMAIFKELL